MSLLDQPHWNVTIHAWTSHRRNHNTMPDPTCVFCDCDQWQPGNRKGEQCRTS